MKRERDYSIEFLRVICCFLVVCIHVANYYCRGFDEVSNTSYLFAVVVNCVSRISVPIFFMISGALLMEEKPFIKKSIWRTWNTGRALIIWSVVYYVWNLWYRDQPYDFKQLFEAPVKRHLWFLYALLGIYIVLPFLQWMVRDIPEILMKYFTILWITCLTLNYIVALLGLEITYDIPLIGGSCYLGYFIMGYIVNHFRGRIRMRHRLCYGLSVGFMVITIAATYLYSLNLDKHVDRFLQYRNVLIGASATMVFIGVLQNGTPKFRSKAKKVIKVISKHSFTIYLAHILFLDIFKKEVPIWEIPSIIGIPVIAIIVFLITLLFASILNRIDRKSRMLGLKIQAKLRKCR